jgi:hypothetical protein
MEPRPAGELTPALLSGAARAYVEALDETYGGFGGAPKFPPSTRLAVLLAEHRRRPDAKTLRAVTLTLDRMARGGVYDQVGGGFHRYSTDARWLVPHFEKMLYDNALLAAVYLEVHESTGNEYYRRIGVETLDFALRELRDPKGGFWSALDADSPNAKGEREEGLFYVWTPREVAAVLGEKDAALFNRVYGVTAGGNWEGKSIPNLIARSVEGRGAEAKLAPAALWARLDALRARLRAAREKRPRPHRDDKVLANWNGLMIGALARGYDVTGDARYRKAAAEAASFVLTAMRREGKLLHSYRAGKTQPQSFLEDYAFVCAGLLELHGATGEERWLAEARTLCGEMISRFWDEKAGRIYATPHDHEALLVRLGSAEDGPTPSGPSAAALALLRVARLTGDVAPRQVARRLLEGTRWR